jgi:hypothetical protein
MEKVLRYLARTAMAATMLAVPGASQAHAIVIREALLSGGAITVSGSRVAKSVPITWEGTAVTTSSARGRFTFTTTLIPADCVGTLSDGTATIVVAINGCSPVSTLPATGQTISYAIGDDGDFQAGAALSYTDNGDGTVTDDNTGLVWEKKTSANVNSVYTWQGALDYVAALNAMNGGQGFAGYNDWRLPNIRELLTIVDYSRHNPPIHPIFGPTRSIFPFSAYWSSTSWAEYYPAVNAWAVDFAEDFAHPSGTRTFGKTSSLLVRAVRGD